MRIAVTANGPSLNDRVSSTCTEATHFIFMNLASDQWYAFEHPQAYYADPQEFPVVESLLGSGIAAVLLQECKPEVLQRLQVGGIRVYTHVAGTVAEVIEQYQLGVLMCEAMPAKYTGTV